MSVTKSAREDDGEGGAQAGEPSGEPSGGPSPGRGRGRPWPAVRRDPAAREIVRRWRALSGGAPTLVACSGGADSSALVVVLAAARAPISVGHVVHDMRPREESLPDRDAARALAARAGARFVEREVVTTGRGNREAVARAERRRALADMAREVGAAAVVTAHHADDQLESVVLALVRGAGPRGLSGIAPSQRLREGVRLLRPMLGVTREDARRICALAGVTWREDATNADRSRARAALRHGPLAEIARSRPGAALAASRAADLLRDASALVDRRAAEVFGDALRWSRDALRAEPDVVVGAGLRRAVRTAAGSAEGMDRLGLRATGAILRAVRDRRTHERRFALRVGGAGVEVVVGAREVAVVRGGGAGG